MQEKKGAVTLPRRRTSWKALRIIHKRTLRNLQVKTDLRKTIKKLRAFLTQKNTEEAKTTLKVLFKKFDKAVKLNLLHKNTVARRKSRYSKMLQGHFIIERYKHLVYRSF